MVDLLSLRRKLVVPNHWKLISEWANWEREKIQKIKEI
jgi:hypothetical protein